MVIWLIGLAGAGKTTIGREVVERLRRERPAVFLDGDDFRAIMGNDLGHSMEDRRTNAWRICRLCEHLDKQGVDVVCAILSLFHDTQDWNREHYSQYFEVFVDAPMEILMARDQKSLYSRARAGQIHDVVGIDIDFVPPPLADLVVTRADPAATPGELAHRIVEAAGKKFP